MLHESVFSRLSRTICVLGVAFVSSGFAGDRITQFATIDSLLSGVYDGPFECTAVKAAGNLGLGTFNNIDGEMIVLDGVVYRVSADGSIAEVADSTLSPFAAVIDFAPEGTLELTAISDFSVLQERLEDAVGTANFPIALRLTGTFSAIKTRAPRAQSKPYPPLAEVVKTQAVFEGTDLHGTLVGFYFPTSFKGLNVPGLHLHFLSDDHTFGGHLLAFSLHDGILAWDLAESFDLRLPATSDSFRQAPLDADRSTELKAVEADR